MDRLMIEYLRNKGRNDMNEQEFMHKFKEFMSNYKRNSMKKDYMEYDDFDDFIPARNSYMRRHGDANAFSDMFNSNDMLFDRFKRSAADEEDMYKMMRYLRNAANDSDHFSDSEAKYLVSEMYHTESGRKHSGEKFDMHKAKEVCERYRGVLPISVKPADVYVAINAQYHDYAELFKNWFGSDIDQKIIESAIVFWFKDVDSPSKNKLMDYFKEH